MESTDYQYQALTESNLHWLIPLYQKIFNKKYSLEQIRAKYQPYYTGINAQGHFALYDGKPVAFHGAIPVFMNYKDQIELAAQYGDAMTLKTHSGKGLFTKLGKLTDEVLKTKNVRFVWGFPNQNSEYGYVNKLDWKGKNRMQAYILPLAKISSEVISRKSKVGQKKVQKLIESKLEPIRVKKQGLQSVDDSNFPTVDRSKDFYNYKQFSPNYMIRVNGVKAWIKTEGGLLIGDMEAKDEKQFFKTIAALKELGKSLGLHKVIIQLANQSQQNKWMKKEYAAVDSWLIGYKNFNSEFPLDQLQLTYGDLDTF
jgi:hypothetical protein